MWISILFGLIQLLPESRTQIEGEVHSLLGSAYPELKPYSIQIRSMRSQIHQFAASVDGFYRPAKERTYVIHVNPKVFEKPPTKSALTAILAHELEHLLDYTKMNSLELAWLYFRYEVLGDSKFIADYEKRTDLKAIQRGFGNGLKEFREWLYAQIGPEKLHKKMPYYLTPREIDEIVAVQSK